MTTDTRIGEFWSTIDVRLDQPMPTFTMEWFSYALSQQVPGGVGRVATQADTNLWRAGSTGLPQDWAITVRAWRARAIAPRALLRSDAWWAWCATVLVDFRVDDRTRAVWTLDELLRAARPRDTEDRTPGAFGGVPVRIEKHRTFVVKMVPTQHEAMPFGTARKAAVLAEPAYAVLEPAQWTPIKLRCYLAGDITTAVA